MKTSACDAPRSDAGTTLLEVLIVLSLLSLILVSTGFLVRSDKNPATVQSIGDASIDMLRAAKVRAASSGHVVRVEFDPGNRTIGSPDLESTIRLGEDMRVSVEAASEVADQQGAAILFFPDGTSTGGKITLTEGGDSRVITVHWLTGLVHDGRS